MLWRNTLGDRPEPNTALATCAGCALNRQCHWNDPGALSDEAKAAAEPIAALPPQHRRLEFFAPEVLTRRSSEPRPEVICWTPWTTMEITDPDGRTRQCGADWTLGSRGNYFDASLAEIWNGPGYQEARRIMGL